MPGFALLRLSLTFSVVSSVGARQGAGYLSLSGGGALAGRSGASAGRSALESSLRPVVCEEDN